MRKKPRLLGVLLALLMPMVVGLALFGMLLLWEPGPGVTPGNFYCVQIGMGEKEVEQRFGGPAEVEERKGKNSWKFWFGQEATCAHILFGPDGVVLDGIFVRNSWTACSAGSLTKSNGFTISGLDVMSRVEMNIQDRPRPI